MHRIPLAVLQLACVSSALALAAPAHAGLYKCTQADGRTTFQDLPCPAQSTGGQHAIVVTPPSASPPPAAAKRVPAAPASRAQANREQAAESARAERAQIEAYNRSVRCNAARQNLGVLRSGRPVFTYGNQGERQYLDDPSRTANEAAAQREVEAHCS